MGLFGSKHADKDVEETPRKSKIDVSVTPNTKLKIIQLDKEYDPRSPSENIARTPIQLLSSEMNGTTPKKIEMPDFTPAKVIVVSDPRSPTTDYRRTPIVVGVLEKSPVMKIHNKNLDKALKGFSTISSQKSTPKKSNIIPPKLLEKTPVRIVKADAYKRRSCVGLLETNVDYTETDIDKVIFEKYRSPSMKKALSEPKMYNRVKTILKEANVDPRSPTTDFIRTPLQIARKLNESNINIDDCPSSDDGSETKSVEVDLNTVDNGDNNVQDEKLFKSLEGVALLNKTLETEMPDLLISSRALDDAKIESNAADNIYNKPQEIEHVNHPSNVYNTVPIIESIPSKKSPKQIAIPTEKLNITPENKIDLTADLRDFDKKLTNLIYEDDDLLVPLPVRNKGTNRTPLGVRNVNTNEPKKCSRLKVSDKPRRSTEKGNSKIPVPQNRNNKKFVQCENTPPRNMYNHHKSDNMKFRKPQWDNDKTLLI